MRQLNRVMSVITGGTCLILAACATDVSINREASVQLEPLVMLPEPSIGEEIRGLDKGELSTTKVVAVEGGLSR